MRTKRVELKNNHKNDYNQVIHGERYLIKSGESINLSRRQAVDVRGHYAQGEKGEDIEVSLELIPIPDAVAVAEVVPEANNDLLKRIEALEGGGKAEKVKIYGCPFCDKEYAEKRFLASHMKSHGGKDGGHDSSADSD